MTSPADSVLDSLPDTRYSRDNWRRWYCVAINGMRIELVEKHGQKVLRLDDPPLVRLGRDGSKHG